MKRFMFVMLLIVVLVCIMTTPAFAGLKDWIKGNAFDMIVGMAITLVAGLLGGTVLGKILLKAKAPLLELDDVFIKVHQARQPDSAGGKTITSEEKDAILKEVEDVLAATMKAFGRASPV